MRHLTWEGMGHGDLENDAAWPFDYSKQSTEELERKLKTWKANVKMFREMGRSVVYPYAAAVEQELAKRVASASADPRIYRR